MKHDVDRRSQRNTRARAAQNILAVFMCMTCIAMLGLFIVALAGSFGERTWLAAGATVVLLAAGILAARAGGRRRTVESSVLVFSSGSPETVFDVDRVTAVRTEHSKRVKRCDSCYVRRIG